MRGEVSRTPIGSTGHTETLIFPRSLILFRGGGRRPDKGNFRNGIENHGTRTNFELADYFPRDIRPSAGRLIASLTFRRDILFAGEFGAPDIRSAGKLPRILTRKLRYCLAIQLSINAEPAGAAS